MNIFPARYDLAMAPPSWDFAAWLTNTSAACAEGDMIGVRFFPGPSADGFRTNPPLAMRPELRPWMLNHVCRGLMTVMLNVFEFTDSPDRSSPPYWVGGYGFRYSVERAMQGPDHYPRKFQAGPAAHQYVERWLQNRYESEQVPAFITITVRRSSYHPDRNNDEFMGAVLEQLWVRGILARTLQLVIVPDAESVGLWDGEYLPAAYDVALRLALYEKAQLNIVGDNGPAGMLFNSNANYLMIQPLLPFDGGPDMRTWWRTHDGLDPEREQQFPWASKLQMILWDHPTTPTQVTDVALSMLQEISK